MIMIKVPQLTDFWVWLCRFSYRRAVTAATKTPVGLPLMRDPEARCDCYEPYARGPAFTDCHGDGHYLCMECVHLSPDAEMRQNYSEDE